MKHLILCKGLPIHKLLMTKSPKCLKLLHILLLASCFQLNAKGFSQNVSLSVKNESLEKVFTLLQQQTGYTFFYDRQEVRNTKPVTIEVKNETFKATLDLCFKNQPLTYTIVTKTVVVKRIPTSAEHPENLLTKAGTVGQQPAINVKGQVLNTEDEVLTGVSVELKGTDIATVTDLQGNYNISIPGAGILVFTHVGYLKKEISVTNQSVINTKLERDLKAMSQVVVVGYSTQKKIDLTGSVSVIAGSELTNRQVASPSVALQGMSPGVMVTQQSGLPGADEGTIRIRGVNSMFAGQNPLVLVDNVEMNINAVNLNNVESISILKDASAASIYGSRASNGVILVTTKRGKQRGVSLQYNTYVGLQQATNLPKKVSALDYMKLYDLGLQNVGKAPIYSTAITNYEQHGADNFSTFNTDWKDLMLSNNGLMHNHNMNLSLGTDKANLFASGSFLDQNGLTANTNFKRYDFRFNADVKILSNLTASMDLVLNRSDRHWPYTSPNILMMWMIGLPAIVPGRFNTGEYGEGWNNFNPLAQAEAGGFNDLTGKTTILTGTLKYNPFKHTELLASYSTDNSRSQSRSMIKQYQVYLPDIANNVLKPGAIYPATNSLDENWTESRHNLFRSQITYDNTIGDHGFKILAGFSAEDYQSYSIAAGRQNFINTNLPYLDIGDAGTMTNSGGIGEWSIMSFFSRINYQFKNRYLLELNGRADASSRFTKDNRWGFFPSASAGWRVSQENFWKGSLADVINQFKIRASYGILGNQNLSSFYPTVSQFNPGAPYNYFFNNTIASGYAITQAANPDIQWESSKQFDLGADLSFFNNRLTVTADYFKRHVFDMLQTLPIPLTIALTAPYVNAGSMENTGWELSVGWNGQVRKLGYNITVNLSNVTNEVTDLNDQEYINGRTIIREGFPINSYYGYVADGFFQSQSEIDNAPTQFPTTRPGDIRYRDISGANGKPDNLINNYDRTILGNSFPKYEYSINCDLNWKGLDFSLFMQGVGKRDNYISGYAAWPFYATNFPGTPYEYNKDYWTADNPNASFPRLTVGIDNNQQNSGFWIKSGAYLRLKNAVLGYTIPSSMNKRFHIRSLRFYASGQNLLTFDKFFAGFDPEREDNTGQFYPIMRTFSLGLTLNFL